MTHYSVERLKCGCIFADIMTRILDMLLSETAYSLPTCTEKPHSSRTLSALLELIRAFKLNSQNQPTKKEGGSCEPKSKLQFAPGPNSKRNFSGIPSPADEAYPVFSEEVKETSHPLSSPKGLWVFHSHSTGIKEDKFPENKSGMTREYCLI